MVSGKIATATQRHRRVEGTILVTDMGTNRGKESYVGKKLPFTAQTEKPGIFVPGVEVYGTLATRTGSPVVKYVRRKTALARR